MKAKAELFLYMLLWTAESLARPTWRSATDSFEGWAYQNGFLQEVQRLEARQYLEQRRGALDRRLIRLTEEGRLKALGGRDPALEWRRPWDGKWRTVFFDLPYRDEALRKRLHRFFRERGFGLLQRSVWVTPHNLTALRKILPKDDQVKTFLCLEGTPCGGERDSDIVQGAWDWTDINALYTIYLNTLGSFPAPDADAHDPLPYPERLHRWAIHEAEAWKRAVSADPLLPAELQPRGYLGKKAWKKRIQVLSRAGRAIRKIGTPPS